MNLRTRVASIFTRIAARIDSPHSSPISPNVTVGRHTYGFSRTTFLNPSAQAPVSIGNFCSIAKGVRIICHADHPLTLPSTYPFRTLMTQTSIPFPKATPNHDAITKGPINIGHDVWIGENAIILSGTTIGTGAVIGAGCVVSGTVPPYAVVVGNPKQIIRVRFADHIDRLLASRWWDLQDEDIAALDDAFYKDDIEYFLSRVDQQWKYRSGQVTNT